MLVIRLVRSSRRRTPGGNRASVGGAAPRPPRLPRVLPADHAHEGQRTAGPVRQCSAMSPHVRAVGLRGSTVRVDDGPRAGDVGGQAQLAAHHAQIEGELHGITGALRAVDALIDVAEAAQDRPELMRCRVGGAPECLGDTTVVVASLSFPKWTQLHFLLGGFRVPELARGRGFLWDGQFGKGRGGRP